MGFEILVTRTAASDFEDAISYIALNLKNPSAASSLADDYEEALRRISDNPFLFHCSIVLKTLRETILFIGGTTSKTFPCSTGRMGIGSLSAGFYMPEETYTPSQWK